MLLHRACQGARPLQAPLSRTVATKARSKVVPNYSDRYLQDSRQKKTNMAKSKEAAKSADGSPLPRDTKEQFALWRPLVRAKDSRLDFVGGLTGSQTPSVYTTDLAELAREEESRKQLYEEHKDDTKTQMLIYKAALERASLAQFDHEAMMEACMKEQNLMFLVFFAQTVSASDGVERAMEQAKQACQIILAASEVPQLWRSTLLCYVWCVAAQKSLNTDDISELGKSASVAANTLLEIVESGNVKEHLETIVAGSPFAGLRASLIEVMPEDPKTVYDIYRAGKTTKTTGVAIETATQLSDATQMSVATFGRVLVALTETGRYDAALDLYSHATLQCRDEYTDHVAVIYALLGRWNDFSEILTDKYAQLRQNTNTRALAAVLSRVREAGGGPSLLQYVDDNPELLPFKMAMSMAAGDYETAAATYNKESQSSTQHSSKYGKKIQKPTEKLDPLLCHMLLQVYDHTCDGRKAVKIAQELEEQGDLTPLMVVNASQACVGSYSRSDLALLMNVSKKFIASRARRSDEDGDPHVSSNVTMENAFIRALMRLGGYTEAVAVFTSIEDRADALTYAYLLNGFVYNERWEEFSFYLTRLQRSQIAITPYIYQIIMRYAVARGEIVKAEGLLDELEQSRVELSHQHFQYLLEHYSQSDKSDKAIELFRRMQRLGIRPDGVIARNMLVNIRNQFDYNIPEQRRAALVLMEAAALDIVATSELLDPGVIAPFMYECFNYLSEEQNLDIDKARDMADAFMAKYTAKHGGGESMRILFWAMRLEVLRPTADFGLIENIWRRLWAVAESRMTPAKGYRKTSASDKHAVIMGHALKFYIQGLGRQGRIEEWHDLRRLFKSRGWRVTAACRYEAFEQYVGHGQLEEAVGVLRNFDFERIPKETQKSLATLLESHPELLKSLSEQTRPPHGYTIPTTICT